MNEQILLKYLQNDIDIQRKYNVFFNGCNIIAVVKEDRQCRENVDNVLIFHIIDRCYLRPQEIYNSDSYNYFLLLDNDNNTVFVLSRDILIDDIKCGILKKDRYYSLSNEYIKEKSTRILHIK